MMGSIEDSQREAFKTALFGKEEVSTDLRKILGHSVKLEGIGLLETRLLAEHVYNTSEAANDVLVGSLLGGTDLNYAAQKGCIRRESVDRWKHREFLETEALTRWKEVADGLWIESPSEGNVEWDMAHGYSPLPQQN